MFVFYLLERECLNKKKKKCTFFQAVDRLFWDHFVQNFFTMHGTLKLGLTNVVDNDQKDYGALRMVFLFPSFDRLTNI